MLQDHYSAVRDAWVKAASELKWGNPKEEDTFVGPLISEKEAKRIEEWVQEAVDCGAPPRVMVEVFSAEKRDAPLNWRRPGTIEAAGENL